MNIEIHRQFLKDLAKIPAPVKEKVVDLVFHQLPAKVSLADLSNVKKIQGFQHFYRVRVGEFLVGLEVTRDSVIVKRVLHRKDIYKFFP